MCRIVLKCRRGLTGFGVKLLVHHSTELGGAQYQRGGKVKKGPSIVAIDGSEIDKLPA